MYRKGLNDTLDFNIWKSLLHSTILFRSLFRSLFRLYTAFSHYNNYYNNYTYNTVEDFHMRAFILA